MQNAWRAVGVLALAVAAGLLTACGNAELPGAGLAVASGAEQAPTGTSGDTGFDPFTDGAAQPFGGREVIKDPSIAEVMKPASDLPEMALGRADAPVTFIKYASMTCPYCRQFMAETWPQLKREYIDSGKVRFIIREFPIGFQSGAATVALRCAPPDRYFELYQKLMAQQASWVSMEVRTEPIFKVAQQVGMTRAQFDACRQNQGMIRSLNAIKERGRQLGIIGTPNFFVNGKLIKSVLTMKEIRELVDPIVAGRVATTGKALATR